LATAPCTPPYGDSPQEGFDSVRGAAQDGGGWAAYCRGVIARVWRGWTEPSDADEYEAFVTERVFADASEEISSLAEFEVWRRDAGGEVEFVTVAYFESWDGVEAFAGEAYESAHVPDRAAALLSRYEEDVTHYEVRG